MVLKRYIVEVDPEQARRLTDEQIALATQINTGPTKLLIFRDRFVAYKIATRSGSTVRQGRMVDGDALQGGFSLGNQTLMFDNVAEA